MLSPIFALRLIVTAAWTLAAMVGLCLLTFLLIVPLKADEAVKQECSVEQGAMVTVFLTKHKKDPKVVMEGDKAQRFVAALREVTGGRINLPIPSKLLFVGVELDKGWLMFGYGEPQGKKDCVFGVMGIKTDLLAAAIKKIQDSEI